MEVGVPDIQVGERKRKPLIGIVGGIASGKSSVAAGFGKLGCALIDADAIVHELLETDAVRDDIVTEFGPDVLDGSGRVDRQELGKIAFADGEKLAALNGILHPRVLEETEVLLKRYERDGSVKAVVLDMPLLLEVGWAQRCDKVIFVDCADERRFERARRTRSLTEQEVKKRENFQISLDTKKTLADNTIDNNSEFSTLVRQINDIFSDIAKLG
ncbi:MAG: dephospho-CoA kinase [Phycisphaerales bacterium]|nr:MAG: dephospho-CoA kinase [Phycisphaerales bacterium]